MQCAPFPHRKKTVVASQLAMGSSLLSQSPCMMEQSGMGTYVASPSFYPSFHRYHSPLMHDDDRFFVLTLSLSLSRVCPTQDGAYHLKIWKLSMKESEWTNNATVVLDMKTEARHFREERGFEVPPPPSLSSSVQLELAISLSSCNLSSPDGPSSVASQTPTTQNVCHPCCGPSVCSVQSFDLLACQMQSVFPLTCVISRSLSPC